MSNIKDEFDKYNEENSEESTDVEIQSFGKLKLEAPAYLYNEEVILKYIKEASEYIISNNIYKNSKRGPIGEVKLFLKNNYNLEIKSNFDKKIESTLTGISQDLKKYFIKKNKNNPFRIPKPTDKPGLY